MFCKKCGAQIPDGSVTCPSCGQPLTTVAPSVSTDNKSLTWKNYAVLALGILCLVSAASAFMPGQSDAIGERLGVGATELALLDVVIGVLLILGWNNPRRLFMKWIAGLTVFSLFAGIPFGIGNSLAMLLLIVLSVCQVLIPYSLKVDAGLDPWK